MPLARFTPVLVAHMFITILSSAFFSVLYFLPRYLLQKWPEGEYSKKLLPPHPRIHTPVCSTSSLVINFKESSVSLLLSKALRLFVVKKNKRVTRKRVRVRCTVLNWHNPWPAAVLSKRPGNATCLCRESVLTFGRGPHKALRDPKQVAVRQNVIT